MNKSTEIKGEVEQLLYDAYKVSLDDIVSGISITEKALFKSQKIKDKNAVHADGLNQLALLQRKNKEYQTSKSLSERALDLSTKISYERGIADANYNISRIYIAKRKYNDALPHLTRALSIYQKGSNHKFHVKVLIQIANIYVHFHDFKNADKAFKKALAIINKTDFIKQKGVIYLHLANAELEQGKISKALKSAVRSTEILKEFKDFELLAEAYYILGKSYLKARKLYESEEQFFKALEYYKKVNSSEGIVRAKEKLGEVYFLQENLDKAGAILSEAIKLSENNNLIIALYKCHYNLYKVYKDNNTEKALHHLEEYSILKEKSDREYIDNLVDSYDTIAKIEGVEKEAEAEQEKASIIQEKNTELDSFFYRVSHDLKGPIASLMGLSDLAKRDIKDDVAKNYLKMYDDQIKRLNMIVMELINITELNYKQIKKSMINFYEIIDNCISSYTYLENFSKINFSVDIQSNIRFYSEWYIVNTILQNLIENAVKYSDAEKEYCYVNIAILTKNDFLIIEVEDNGQGIGDEHQDKIFDMFYRASEKASGTGLGLFILKRAVERLKGEIQLNSELSNGSTFTIKLPLAS